MGVRLVIATASRHGSTHEVGDWAAQAIAAEFRGGVEIHRIRCEQVGVETLPDLDAAIIGGSIYAGRWPRSGRTFVRSNLQALQAVPVWAFSACLGDRVPSTELASVTGQRLRAVSHITVGGAVRLADLPNRERALLAAMRVKDTDTRSRQAVESWAVGLGADIVESLQNGKRTP